MDLDRADVVRSLNYWRVFPAPTKDEAESFKFSLRTEPEDWGKIDYIVFRGGLWVVVGAENITVEERSQWWNIYPFDDVMFFTRVEEYIAVFRDEHGQTCIIDYTEFAGDSLIFMDQFILSKNGASLEELRPRFDKFQERVWGLRGVPRNSLEYDYHARSSLKFLKQANGLMRKWLGLRLSPEDVRDSFESLRLIVQHEALVITAAPDVDIPVNFNRIPELWVDVPDIMEDLSQFRIDAILQEEGMGDAGRGTISKIFNNIRERYLNEFWFPLAATKRTLVAADFSFWSDCHVISQQFNPDKTIDAMINTCIFYTDGTIRFALDMYMEFPNLRDVHVEAGNVVSSIVETSGNLLVVEHVTAASVFLTTAEGPQEFPQNLIRVEDRMLSAGLVPFITPEGNRYEYYEDVDVVHVDGTRELTWCQFVRFTDIEVLYCVRNPQEYGCMWVNSLSLQRPVELITTHYEAPRVKEELEKKPERFSEFGTPQLAMAVVVLFGIAYALED